MTRLIAAFAFFFLTAGIAEAAVQAETGFARDFETASYQTYAFSKGKSASLYDKTDEQGYGLNLGGVLSSTDTAPRASSGLAFGGTGAADLEHNATLTTMMLNGTLDLPGVASRLLVKPYLLGGVGVAVYDTTTSAGLAPEARGTDVIPVFKFGGGFAFRMEKKLDLSLAYKAGFASSSAVSGRDQQSAAMQMVDVSLRYKF